MRLIDADALIDIYNRNSITDLIVVGDKTVKQHVYDAPTIDAVPVVRCKDCKHWEDTFGFKNEVIKMCKRAHYFVGENGYCVYGERMDGDPE